MKIKCDPIFNELGQRRATQEYPKPNSKFQRELDEVIRKATEKYVYEPRRSSSPAWMQNDNLD